MVTSAEAIVDFLASMEGVDEAALEENAASYLVELESLDAEVEEAFEELSAFMESHPEVYWDPSKSFASIPAL